MRILQVSTAVRAGGAEQSAHALFERYRALGHESWLAVGAANEAGPGVLRIPNDSCRNTFFRASRRLGRRGGASLAGRALRRLAGRAERCAEPIRSLRRALGIEDFEFPGSRRLLELPPNCPDIVHCHNLHGGYFDLRALPAISRRVPVVLNLRDAWPLSGHCAYSFGCTRWRTGCGHCPDLALYPPIGRDATAFNWRRKQRVFRSGRYYITTPSQWLMRRVEQSLLAPGIADSRVVPNGVDTIVFRPGSREQARAALGIPEPARVLLFAAKDFRTNVWKDYATLREALGQLRVAAAGRPLLCVGLGETGGQERIGDVELRLLPFEGDRAAVAQVYRAADIFLHPAHVESFGNTILEARASGIPVVASAVGGVPEHLKSLVAAVADTGETVAACRPGEATGILVAPAQVSDWVKAITLLLGNADLCARLGAAGAGDARANHSLEIQARRFLAWYREIILSRGRPAASGGGDVS